jgi:hypothetical protein
MKTLTNPTDDQLNSVFALTVAKWTFDPDEGWRDEHGFSGTAVDYHDFTRSMDAVLPWLDKTAGQDGFWRMTSNGSGVSVVINYEQYAVAATPALAAVIALLHAHGVEVLFTHKQSY